MAAARFVVFSVLLFSLLLAFGCVGEKIVASPTPSVSVAEESPSAVPSTSPTPLPVSQAALGAYVNGDLGFSLDAPFGWEKDESGESGALAVFSGPEKDGNRSRIIAVVEDFDGALDEYVSLSKTAAVESLDGYALESEEDVLLDGVRAKALTYAYAESGSGLKAKSVVFVRKKSAVTLTYVAPAEQYADAEPTFNSVLNGIKFEKS